MHVAGAGLLCLVALAQTAPGTVPAVAPAGQTLFEGRGGCLTCHAVDGAGGRSARELSWVGLLRTPEALRRSVTDPMRHPDAAALSAQEVDQLVAYLRTRRKMWAIERGERSRDIAPATENAAFFNRPARDSEERPERLMGALDISPGATVAERIDELKLHEIDLTDGAVLETNCVYIVPLLESLALPPEIVAAAVSPPRTPDT